jgi:hypothetical protein
MAVEYAEEAFLGMVHLMRTAQSEMVRLAAMDKILDRTFGKAPQHIDIAAIKHTEIAKWRTSFSLICSQREKRLEAEILWAD